MLASMENREVRIRTNPFNHISLPCEKTASKNQINGSRIREFLPKIPKSNDNKNNFTADQNACNSPAQIHALILKKNQKKVKKLNSLLKDKVINAKVRQVDETKNFFSDSSANNKYQKNADETIHDYIQSTSSNCILTGSCPELSQLDKNFIFCEDEFEFDTNPTLSKALSNSVGDDGISSKNLLDLDKQIVKELQLEEKFKNWRSSSLSDEDIIDHESLLYEKLIQNHIIATNNPPNPGKGVKSIHEEIEENEYVKKCIIVNSTANGAQTELWKGDTEECDSETRKKLVDFKLPRTTYIEEDLDTDMQIVVNCYDENTGKFKNGDLFTPRSKVCCALM